jgi:hypothetical protein
MEGALISSRNNSEQTALDMAMQKEHTAVVEMLKRAM